MGFLALKDWADRPGEENSAGAIVQRASAALSGLRDAQVFALVPPAIRGLGQSNGFTMELRNTGNLPQADFAAAKDRLVATASKDPLLAGVRATELADNPTLHVDFDQPKLAVLGLNSTDVSQTLSAAWGGAYVNDFIDRGRVKRVYVEGDAQSRSAPDDLAKWYVRGGSGQMVPFTSFATASWTTAPTTLSRFSGVPSFEIQGQASPGTSSGQAMARIAELAGEIPGTDVAWAGLSYQERQSSGQAPLLYGLSLLVVFLCLAALYESWSIPIAVLLVIPLGLVGAVVAVTLRGLENDVFLQIGLLTTMGLASKNAILMIEFAEQAEKEGKRVIDAALEAATLRLRPILMTSLAFMFGVLPLALSTGAGANGRIAIGTAVIGGMLTATVLAVFYIPLFLRAGAARGARRAGGVKGALGASGRPDGGRGVKRWIALPLLLAGCTTLQPAYDRPVGAIPAGWPVGDAALLNGEASLASVTYTDVFRDPRLQALVAQALANNRDLRSAVANIRAARAQYRIQRSTLIPNVAANGGFTESRGPVRGGVAGGGVATGGVMTGDGTIGGTTGGGTGAGGTVGGGGVATGGSALTSYTTASVGVTAYEIDLFGRLRSLSETALNQYFATEAAARSVRLTLVGDLASAWATLAADRELLAIAQDTVASAGQSVDLTRLRLDGGVSPRTDLRQAELVLETARADLALQTTAVARDRNFIQRLVGAPVADAQLPSGQADIADAFGPVPAGLSSTILIRRPDVVQAEYQLIAANANIGAARAALFPRLSLTGLLGLASTSLTGLFNTDAFTASVGPNVSVPIFDGGARRANVALSVAQRGQLIAEYEGTLQTAFREVADALARRATIDEQIAANERQRAAALDNFDLVTARYRGGIDTFLSSLIAQRTLYQARRTLVDSRLTRDDNAVTLYVALGGDPTLNGLPLESPEDGSRRLGDARPVS